MEIGLLLLKALAFFAVVTVIGAWILPHEPVGFVARVPILGRIGLRHLFWLADDDFATLPIILVALVIGLAAHAFGLHPAVGAYMAGLILREEFFVERDTTYCRRTPSTR